jgi:predicted Rossmann fold nucleotide-binding protein DprA/Smf involved in DNA uptake
MPKKQQKPSESVDQVLGALNRIEQNLRLLVRSQLMPAYVSNVNSPQLEKLYANTGRKPVSELAKESGFSTGKISMLWQKWEQAGLLVKNGTQYTRTL